MKYFSKFFASSVATAFAAITVMTVGFSGAASAACYQYSANGMVTSNTPVYNNICDAPNGIGSEADFVRVRQSSNGNVTDNANNPTYQNAITAACNGGDKFDVWNYMHNDAPSDLNNNGSGSAVAHNVKLALSAPTGTTNSNFTFGATISASNAASVSDTATLNCGSKQVKLTLVPSTVHIYSQQYGWNGLPDGAVNGSTKIGSPTLGSGDQWGCWEYRVVVVYQVTVTPVVTPPTVTAMCTLFKVEATADRKVTVTNFTYDHKNATFKNVVINWAEGTPTTVTDATKVVGQTHQYTSDGIYQVRATVNFTNDVNGSAISSSPADCQQIVTFSSTKPPIVTPPTTPPVTPPTTLVNTGAGSIVGIFAATAAAGMVAYRWFISRRLSQNG